MKKIFSTLLAMTVVLSIFCVPSFAASVDIDETTVQEQGIKLLSRLLDRQFEANKTGKLIDTNDILADTPGTTLYKQYLYWYSGLTAATKEYWTEYDYTLNFDSIENGAAIFTADLSYGRTGTIGRSEGHGFEYRIQLVEQSGRYYISHIDSGEMNFDGFKTLVSGGSNEGIAPASEDISIISEDALDSLIEDYVKLKASDATADINPNDVVDMEAEHATYLEGMASGAITEPAAISYSYDRERGRRYADIYYTKGNFDCFKRAPENQGNCTNWVSQCVWAAYGGWSDGDSVATMSKNIVARKRMQPSTTIDNWFGHKNGLSNPWANVTHFWNFVTGSHTTGPKATGYNDGKKWAGNFKSTDIVTGQVLQVKNRNSGRYAHSVYVTGGRNDSIGNIWITQHTPYTKIKLDEFIRNWGGNSSCYLRQLKFTSANFDK